MKRKWTPLRIVVTIVSAVLGLVILGFIVYFAYYALVQGGYVNPIGPIRPIIPKYVV